MAMASSSGNNGRENFRERLMIIDSNLGTHDVKRLKFLCRDFIFQKKLEVSKSALDIFNHLLVEDLLSEADPSLLAELLYIMKQNLLLKHLNYTKEQVKNMLSKQRKVSLFRKLLYKLSENIDSETLQSMMFLRGESMSNMSSISFLERLEKQGVIDENNLKILEDLCKKVAPHLIKKIEKYKKKKASQVVTSPVDKETESLPQGEEEVFSHSSMKQLCRSLPETNVYRMDRKRRGHCVVINNHTFTSASLQEREGTSKDADCLKHLFQWLGFHVNIYVDVTNKHLKEILQKYQNHPDHNEGDCFVFCVLTHGILGAVYSSDGVLIPIQEITSHFIASKCPGLANKPKLFFIQACQGEAIQPSVSIEADAVNSTSTNPLQDSIPVEADFLLGLATVPGYVSFRHKKEGSWYIQSLYAHLKDLVPRQEDILSILTAVNDDVSRRGGTKKQMPQPVFTLRKKVIFPVPQEELSL